MTVRDTVAAPIEQQVSGVENMLYMSSQCTNDGAYTLHVTFKMGMDSDMAQVLVQNRVSLALPVIPDLVQREGINVKKMSPSTMMIVNLISPDRTLRRHLPEQLRHDPDQGRARPAAGRGQRRLSWASATTACGPGSIPNKLASLDLTADDVVNAINRAEPAGRRRPDRPAAGPDGPAVSTHDQHAGPARRCRAVRRHHRQSRQHHERAEHRHRPPARRGPHRTRRPSNTTSRARSTASRRWRCRSTSCPAPTPWKRPEASMTRWTS